MASTHSNELLLMTEDNAGARSPFKVTDLVWTSLAVDFRRFLDADTLELSNFNNRFASYAIGDRHYKGYAQHIGVEVSDDWYKSVCEAYLEKLRALDEHGVIERVNVVLDWDALLSLEEVIDLVNVDPSITTEPKVIVDLGSGWGRVGHVLKTLNPNIAYIACDIPESLIVAQAHLPTRLSGVVHPYSKNREVERFTRQMLLDEGGVRFCGTQHLDKFEDASVDVFLNFFSFQEMTMQQVTEYFEVIDRITKGGIFLSGQRNAGDVMTRENYPYPSQWRRFFERGVIFSPTYFKAAFRI